MKSGTKTTNLAPLAILLALLLSPFAHAAPATQPAAGEPGERRGIAMLERVREALNDFGLTDAQKQKINDIFEQTRKEIGSMGQELRQMDPQERGQRMRQFMDDLRTQLREQLTDDQKTKLDEKMQELRGQLQQRFGGAGATSQPAGPGQRPGQMLLQRLQEDLAKLDLTDEQKGKIKSIVEDARGKMQELRAKVQAGTNREELRNKALEIFTDVREQIGQVLTPEQRAKMRESFQDLIRNGPGGRRASGGATGSAGSPTTKPASGDMQAPEEKKGKDGSSDGPKTQGGDSPPDDAVATSPPDVGAAAPEFALEKLDGRSVQLSSFKGKVLVIEFGSYSCPTFRERAAPMQQLAHEAGNRAQFLVIYTREAHPSDGWQVDRNRDENITIPQHKTIADRKTAAKEAREALHISFPIAIDDMNDSVAKAYGAGANGAVVIGRDGTILARQKWADPSGLLRVIDEAAKVTR